MRTFSITVRGNRRVRRLLQSGPGESPPRPLGLGAPPPLHAPSVTDLATRVSHAARVSPKPSGTVRHARAAAARALARAALLALAWTWNFLDLWQSCQKPVHVGTA